MCSYIFANSLFLSTKLYFFGDSSAKTDNAHQPLRCAPPFIKHFFASIFFDFFVNLLMKWKNYANLLACKLTTLLAKKPHYFDSPLPLSPTPSLSLCKIPRNIRKKHLTDKIFKKWCYLTKISVTKQQAYTFEASGLERRGFVFMEN